MGVQKMAGIAKVIILDNSNKRLWQQQYHQHFKN